ncbi:MAG: hypothetical protein QM487_15325 [Candidatus Marithrix sp.]
MSNAKLVIQKYIEDNKTVGKTIVDLPFDNLPFLTAKEPVFNMKGEKISKSYFDTKGKEAVKIVYKKLIETYEGINNVFVGVQKEIQFKNWAGEVGYTKKKQPYYFTLQPIFDTIDTSIIVDYSSPKQRQILKAERYNADDYLQAQNPTLYSLIYDNYTALYENYLRSGNKTALVDALNNETNIDINNVLNGNVYGLNITIKELILMNLQ